MNESQVEKVVRAICREKCADMGEPPCHEVVDYINPDNCDCLQSAKVALSAMQPSKEVIEAAERVDRLAVSYGSSLHDGHVSRRNCNVLVSDAKTLASSILEGR